AVAARSSAVRLFVERASAAVPGFALDSGNAAAVSAVVRRLDGIPLALELVAPRLRGLSADRLVERLDDRFTLPSAGGRGRPARQRTLQAMIDWSWEPLTEDERTVLRRLAAHPDGCAASAAEAVCADPGLPGPRVLDVVARLVDRSLVVREGERFRLLESVAAYCAERLAEAGELAMVCARAMEYYLGLAERADAELRGPGQCHWLERLDAETVNLRRVLDTALQTADAEAALRLVNAMAWYWFLRGRLAEARRSLHAALALDGGPPDARAAARGWLTGVELRIRPVGEVEPLTGVEDPALRARLLGFVGSGLYSAGRHAEGERLIAQSLAGSRANGDVWGEAAALAERAGHALAGDRPEAARADAERAAARFRSLGDAWGTLRATRPLALLADLDGDHTTALRLHRETLRVAEDLALWTEVADTLTWLGRTTLRTGDLREAERLYERALCVSSERSYTPGEIRAEIGLSRTARRRGDVTTAETHLCRALSKSRTLSTAEHP
ncbi:MAG TPA: tetratricopeptide repeat protein, partial [Thermomonospora sp.]|nr:tetratricopeptide repeat protein [Thermomonospora sp.]